MLRASSRRILPPFTIPRPSFPLYPPLPLPSHTQNASSLLPPAVRGISSISPRLAVPSTAVHSNETGLLAWLLGRKPATKIPPLYEALPGVKLPTLLPDSLEAAPTEITTLDNGLKIASENIPGSAITVGLYVDAGSVNETPETAGSAHLLERMAFKSTLNRTHFRVVRELEAIGGNVTASASREQMAYTGDAIKTHMPEIVELLVDCVRNPVFYDWEVKEQVERVRGELADLVNNPQALLLEALHAAGYQGSLAQPLVISESALSQITAESLGKFVQENYTAPKMVLAASGVNHKELLAVAEPLLCDMPAVSPHNEDPDSILGSVYTGGEFRATANTPKVHVAVAFETPGGWRNEKDSIAVTVLQTLLGGGGSFSTGGPGKGMYSRLYTKVLNRYAEVESILAFSSIYNDTGLFGIHGSTDADFAENLVEIICNQLNGVAKEGSVKETELLRAKNSTISAILMNLESRVVVTEDIGRQILTYGHRKPIQSFVDQVNRITLADIHEIAAKILATPVTLASWGDVVSVPRYDGVCGEFTYSYQDS